MKHNIQEFSLFLKIFYFVSKGSLNFSEYRFLLFGRVQYLYIIEHAVENIAFHRFQSISVTLLSLVENYKIQNLRGIHFVENQSPLPPPHPTRF